MYSRKQKKVVVRSKRFQQSCFAVCARSKYPFHLELLSIFVLEYLIWFFFLVCDKHRTNKMPNKYNYLLLSIGVTLSVRCCYCYIQFSHILPWTVNVQTMYEWKKSRYHVRVPIEHRACVKINYLDIFPMIRKTNDEIATARSRSDVIPVMFLFSRFFPDSIRWLIDESDENKWKYLPLECLISVASKGLTADIRGEEKL